MSDLAETLKTIVEDSWSDGNLTRAKKSRIQFTATKTLAKQVSKPYTVEFTRISSQSKHLTPNLRLNRETIQIDIWVKPQAQTYQALKDALQDRFEIEREVKRIINEKRTNIPNTLYTTVTRTIHRDELEEEPTILHTTLEAEATYTT
ncbi:MAG: hypothetical protein QW282_06220 [Nitrososphaerales archaeon]